MMSLSETEINLRRLLAAAPQQQNQAKLLHYVGTLREQLEQLGEERTPEGLPRVSKSTLIEYSEKIEALAAKLAAPEDSEPDTQEPSIEMAVTETLPKPNKANAQSLEGLRRWVTYVPVVFHAQSLGNVDGDAARSFVNPTQSSGKKTTYNCWSVEENKILLNGYFYISNDSEMRTCQKAGTFWGKVTDYLKENYEDGKGRTSQQVKSHFRHINKKISTFVGCYGNVCRQKHSGWSDDDCISKALELYQDTDGKRFSLLEEWKLVRNQPRYATGKNASESSGSKQKSGDDDEVAIPTMVHSQDRNATKKKARVASSNSSTTKKAKAKTSSDDELYDLTSTREILEKSRAAATAATATATAMLEYAHVRKLELLMTLKSKEDRDEIDEATYNMLVQDLFPNK